MLFGNCKSKTNVQILKDDVSVERVIEIKFLGVMIDHKICWKLHSKYIQSKISRSIAVLSKAKHFLNYAALHILYCSLILSITAKKPTCIFGPKTVILVGKT